MTQLATAIKVVSVITVAEVRAGAFKMNWHDAHPRRQQLESTLAAYLTIGIDAEIATVWADLSERCRKTGNTQQDNDLWIAATAVRLDCPVATLDEDFLRIPGIRVIPASGVEEQT